MVEAKESKKMKEILSEPKVKVLGTDTNKTLFISSILYFRLGLGTKPCSTINGTCIKECIIAAKITPKANPFIPKIGKNTITPRIIPILYKTGLSE